MDIKRARGRETMKRTVIAASLAVLLLSGLGGCLDRLGLGALDRPNYPVSRTALATTDGWNTDPTFVVQVQQAQPVAVRIDARPEDGSLPRSAEGLSDLNTTVTLTIPDGTWTVSYTVGGHAWETFKDARFDSTPPTITGLEDFVDASSAGTATVGAHAVVEAGATVEVRDQSTGIAVAHALPASLSGLTDGVHPYDVVATDAAGNQAVATVQVLAGAATQLPAPLYTAGIVARYTTTVRMWDLTDLKSYPTPAAARAAQPNYLGSGTGITPDDPDVRAVVNATVNPGMTTAEAALALYHWMFDHLDYDESRLDDDNLLTPAQTLHAHGGVCRDLAALYVSLLRADGIPSRLVAGYLAGRVNGFHAWAEFYGGGADPWVPVDVSGIDGAYDPAAMLQSFAIAIPEHLGMRALTPAEEKTDWSSAATLSYTAPTHQPAPDAPFKKTLTVESEVHRTLCIDEDTLDRHIVDRPLQCKGESYIQTFAVSAVRTLDYGVQVRSISTGTTIEVSVVYPDAGTVSPDKVEYEKYVHPGSTGIKSSGFHEDPATGRATASLKA
jgi:transglutaminase-like putative cysteine protease